MKESEWEKKNERERVNEREGARVNESERVNEREWMREWMSEKEWARKRKHESRVDKKMDGINRKKGMKLIYDGHKSRIDGSVRLIILFMPNFYKLD